MNIFAYHCTDIDPEIIKRDGFKLGHGYTEENQFESLYEIYLPAVPCFISDVNAPVWDLNSKYCIKIDITDFELYPDFGHLLDLGAYYDEPDDNGDILFWWKDKELTNLNSKLKTVPKLKEYLIQHNGYLHSEDFTGDMSLEMIGTACIDGEQLKPEDIVEVKQRKQQVTEALSGSDSAKLRRDMKKSVVEFSYKKKSTGSIRKAKGTLKKSELPKFAEDRPAKRNLKNFVYWDTEKNQFRCFNRNNFIKVEGAERSNTDKMKKDIKDEKKMSESNYIEYVAHMLDESFPGEKDIGDRSYYACWAQEFPEYADTERLKSYLAGLFDKYVMGVDGIDGKLKTFVTAYENSRGIPYDKAATSLLAAFKPDEITNRSYFWEPIPAQTYRAIISRNRAKAQGKISHEVSQKVLKDCLDTICRSASIIEVHDEGLLPALRRTETYRKLVSICENRQLADELVQDLYLAFSSFTTVENGNAYDAVHSRFSAKYSDKTAQDAMNNHFDEFNYMMWDAIRKEGAGQWLCNQSDGEIGARCLRAMKEIPYDVYERPEEAIPLISKLIDWSHIRGDVAGAFVEGGAKTCTTVSNMKPDELYENTSKALI